MDRRVGIHHQTTSRDLYGQVEETYTATATVWADVVYRGSPREKLLESSMYPSAEIAVTIRHPRGSWTATHTMQLTFNGDFYDVVGIQEIGRREGLRLFCERLRK